MRHSRCVKIGEQIIEIKDKQPDPSDVRIFAIASNSDSSGSIFLDGPANSDDLEGGPLNDYLKRKSGNDKLSGNDGNDYLDGGNGEGLLVGAGEQDYDFRLGFKISGSGQDADKTLDVNSAEEDKIILTTPQANSTTEYRIEIVETPEKTSEMFKSGAAFVYEIESGNMLASPFLFPAAA